MVNRISFQGKHQHFFRACRALLFYEVFKTKSSLYGNEAKPLADYQLKITKLTMTRPRLKFKRKFSTVGRSSFGMPTTTALLTETKIVSSEKVNVALNQMSCREASSLVGQTRI